MFETFSYIGSKTQLLDFLKQCMEQYTGKSIKDWGGFADLLCGTGVVSAYMMKGGCKQVLSNDIQHFAYVISSAYTTNGIKGEGVDVSKLREITCKINNEIVNLQVPRNTQDKVEQVTGINFIYDNYTPAANPPRMYFTEANGYRIDWIRQYIDKMLREGEINMSEFYILLRILLYAVVKVSNIACVYGAFLKNFKSSARNQLILDDTHLDQLISGSSHVTFNKAVDELLSEWDNVMTGTSEVIYLDPPYNRRYDNNYHLLETISRYDYPQITGKTGLRVGSGGSDVCRKSSYYSKKHAGDEFRKTFMEIRKTGCKFLFTSYSSDGVLTTQEICDLLTDSGFTDVKVYSCDYQKLQTSGDTTNIKVNEYLIACTNP